MAAQLFPIVIFMLFGGVIADRYPRALVVGTSDMILSALVIFNGVMFLTQQASVIGLAIVGFFSGILNALWWPAFAGIVPEIVDEENLQPANAIVSFGSNMMNIVGIVSGGIIVAAIGPGWAIICDGVTFFIAGLLVLQLRKFGNRRVNDEHSPTMFEDLKVGWHEFSSRSWVVAVVGGYTVIVMCYESVFSIVGPVLAKEELGGPKPWSWILAALSIGMAFGVVVSMKVKPSRPLILGVGAQFAMSGWMLMMGVSNNLPLIMFMAFLCGVGFDFFMVLWTTALQTHIPREALSRVSSYDAFGSLALAPLGLVIAGPIVERIGTHQTMQIAAVISALTLVAILSVPGVRNLRGTGENSAETAT
jgi:MFS family permease